MDAAGNIARYPLNPPFRNGYVDGEFRAITFTNVGEISLPARFEYHFYSQIPKARSTNDLTCALEVTGEATSISKVGVNLPLLPKEKIHVEDHRLTDVKGVSYGITNRTIPDINDPQVQMAKERALVQAAAAGKRSARPPSKPNALYIAVLIAVFGLPLFFLVRRERIRIGRRNEP